MAEVKEEAVMAAETVAGAMEAVVGAVGMVGVVGTVGAVD